MQRIKQGTIPWLPRIQWSQQSITKGYALILGICLFLWPIVIGFQMLPLRLLWIVLALTAACISISTVQKSARSGSQIQLTKRPFPFLIIFTVCTALAIYIIHLPIAFFSDEAGIAIPSLTLLANIASWITWPGLMLLAILIAACFVKTCTRGSSHTVVFLFAAMVLFSIAVAILIPQTSSLAIRYPPFLHIMQSISTIATFGNTESIRFSNVIWVFLLALGVWYLTPSWNKQSRILAWLTVLLTPLGWSFHVLLYQACGEITIGLCIAILMGRLLACEEDEKILATLIGVLFALWILYRPTAIASLCSSIAVLLFMKHIRPAKIIALIAGPIGLLWISVYFLGSFQYNYDLSANVSAKNPLTPLHALTETGLALPMQLHPIGIIVLLVGSFLTIQHGNILMKMTLLAAWFIGLTNTGIQQIVIPDIWTGYGRLNILMILPLSIVMATLGSLRWGSFLQRNIAISFVMIALIYSTPFDFLSYTHNLRTLPAEKIFHTITAGDAPSPTPNIIKEILQDTKEMIILQPDSAYLDLFIAVHLLSTEERSHILALSKEWTPQSPIRPVIIQAPQEGSTYQPNLSAEEEGRLKEAALWTQTQEKVEKVILGKEVVLIVR
jgi:hypothetical protein